MYFKVVHKIGGKSGYSYIKARPSNERELYIPKIGEPYNFCGLTTSPVIGFSIKGDICILTTENSLYEIFIVNGLKNVNKFANDLKMSGPTQQGMGYYWE